MVKLKVGRIICVCLSIQSTLCGNGGGGAVGGGSAVQIAYKLMNSIKVYSNCQFFKTLRNQNVSNQFDSISFKLILILKVFSSFCQNVSKCTF